MYLQEMTVEWQRQQEATKALREIGAEKYFRNIDGIQRAFIPLEPIAVCMDERIMRRSWRLGGSGILMPKDKLIASLQKNGIQGITTHEGCGAAAMAADGSGLSAEEYAKKWAREISEASGIPYVAHITAEEMIGPKHFHPATVAYYSGSNTFSAAGVKELPVGFHINRKVGSSVKHDLGLALMIAFGDHGFGKERFEQTKFLIIAPGNPNDSDRNAAALKREAEEIVARMDLADFVDIDAFNVPNEWLLAA
ncbi:MAG: hypothetical protein NVSMB66_3180 [Candidatus Doudnabacteria bacterium]